MPFDYDRHAEKFAKLRADWAKQKAAIDAEPHLSHEGRVAKKREAHQAIMVKHKALKDEFKQAVTSERDTRKRAAFSPLVKAHDDGAAIRNAYRTALNEAAAADTKTRRRLLERYDLSGDRLGKKAVLAAALEAGDHGLIAEAKDSDAAAYVEFTRSFGDGEEGSMRDPETAMRISMALTAPSL